MNLQSGIINKDVELVQHSAGHTMFMNKFGDSWLCESCPFKKVCSGYQRRFKQPWTEEDERQEMEKIIEELREKFKIFFPSQPLTFLKISTYLIELQDKHGDIIRLTR